MNMAVSNKKIVILLFLTAILVGIGMRFYGISWGLPYHFNSDEHVMTYFTEKLRTTDSITKLTQGELRFFLYPPFLMYPLIILVTLVSFFHPISPTDPASQTIIHLLGRGIVACFSALTLILIYRLGKRLYNQSVGMLASVFLAFTVLHIRDAHFYFPDEAMIFFIVLTVFFSAAIAENKGMKWYLLAGLCAGIGIATKQTALMVFPVIFMAHCIGMLDNQQIQWDSIRKIIFSFRFWGLSLLPYIIAGITFLLLNPFILINPKRFLAMSHETSLFVKGISQPQWTFQFTGTTISYWFTNLLYFGMGPLLELVCILGMIWAIANCCLIIKDHRINKTQSADLLILFFLLLYFWFIGRGFMKFVRYAIPLLPFLCLLGARFLCTLYEMAVHKRIRIMVGSLIAMVIIASFLYAFAYLNIYHQEDVRIQASKWIHQIIPQGSTVLIDSSSSTPLLGSMFFKPELYTTYLNGVGQMNLIKNDYYVIKVMNLMTGPKGPTSIQFWEKYLKERQENADYIIMSDEYYEQYSHRPDANPALIKFYQDLFSDKIEFHLIKTFKTHPALFGYALNDDRAELTFRLFDHPKIMIFMRSKF